MSTVTDWISAIANGVIAIITMFGYFLARNWKREATKEIMVENGIKILVEIMPNIKWGSSNTLHIMLIKNCLDRMEKMESVNYRDINELYFTAKSYKGSHRANSKVYLSFLMELKKLHHLAWNINKDKETNWNLIKDCIKKDFSDELELITTIEIVLWYWGLKLDDDNFKKLEEGDGSSAFLKDNIHFKNAIDITLRVIRNKENIAEQFKKLDIENITIFDLFEAK